MTEITKRDISGRLARLHADYAALPVIQPQLQRMHADIGDVLRGG